MARTLHSQAPSNGNPAEQSSTENVPMLQRRILIVEDKEQERQILKQFLESPALTVDTVGEGVEALERLNSCNYSIVITDLKMPRLSGMQLIEEVQKRGLPVTVIVTTGFGGIEEAVQAMRLGAYEFFDQAHRCGAIAFGGAAGAARTRLAGRSGRPAAADAR